MGSITISLTPGTGTNPGGGTLSAAQGDSLTQTASEGVASFPGLIVSMAGDGYTLTATDQVDNLTVASDPFNIGGLIVNTDNDDELSQLPPGMLSLRGATRPSTTTQARIRCDDQLRHFRRWCPGDRRDRRPTPDITTPVIIDGTSQPVTGQVEVDGSAL